MEYVWGLICKSLVRGDQGLREKSGVRRAAWENLEEPMWGSVCTVDRHAGSGAKQRGRVSAGGVYNSQGQCV